MEERLASMLPGLAIVLFSVMCVYASVEREGRITVKVIKKAVFLAEML